SKLRATPSSIAHAAPSDVSHPAVSSFGGLRTPAPVYVASSSWAGIRKPSQNRTYVLTATSVSRRAPRRLWSRLVSSLVCSLAGVHLSVVKLGHGTGLAPDGVARLVVIPPAVAVPGAAPRSRRSLLGVLLIERRDLTLLRLDGPVRV